MATDQRAHNYLRRAWQGAVPLWHSYWLLLVLPSVVFRLFTTYWTATGISLAISHHSLWNVVNWGTLILSLGVYCFGAVSVLRNKSRSSWAGLAKGATILGLVVTMIISVASFLPDKYELESQLRDAARGVTMARGQQVDEVTTIKGASYGGGIFVYDYYLTDEAGRNLQSNTSMQFGLTARLKVKACDNIIKGVEHVLQRVEYRYYTTDDTLRFSIPIDGTECIPAE